MPLKCGSEFDFQTAYTFCRLCLFWFRNVKINTFSMHLLRRYICVWSQTEPGWKTSSVFGKVQNHNTSVHRPHTGKTFSPFLPKNGDGLRCDRRVDGYSSLSQNTLLHPRGVWTRRAPLRCITEVCLKTTQQLLCLLRGLCCLTEEAVNHDMKHKGTQRLHPVSFTKRSVRTLSEFMRL